MSKLKITICAICVSALAACAGPQRAADPSLQVSRSTHGLASWYGPGFQGRQTASGERFDQQSMTAAHPTLPFETIVRVTNESNGKSVVVRINDRGPFSGKRIIDLSKGAAKEIGLINSGVGRVKLDILRRG